MTGTENERARHGRRRRDGVKRTQYVFKLAKWSDDRIHSMSAARAGSGTQDVQQSESLCRANGPIDAGNETIGQVISCREFQFLPPISLLGILTKMEYCKEKSRLADEYSRAAEAHCEAAKVLRANTGGDVSQVLADFKRTQNDRGKARRALQSHIVKHRC